MAAPGNMFDDLAVIQAINARRPRGRLMKKLWLRLALMISSSVLLLCVSACSTAPAIPGVVVDAPQVKPPPPELVQRTSARPVGYFRKLVLDALLMP
jgi:hypothetical protein